MNATLTTSFGLPTQTTATAFSSDGKVIAVGSDDGSVRIYEPPGLQVKKAIRGLGVSVSDVVFHAEDGCDCWIAAGKSLLHFDLSISKMILMREDAKLIKDIEKDDEDGINQLVLSTNRHDAHLACTADTGAIYVMDIYTKEVTRMKASHSSIAWTAAFIPDRPNELVTGGYDCTLLLFDFKLGTLLTRLELSPAPSLAPGISSLPPFVTSLAVSLQGIIAAGTADGRIWVGLGGEKVPAGSGKKKKFRKWGGLSEEDGFFTKIEENMISALNFVSPDKLVSCSLHGKIALHHLVRANRSSSEGQQNGLRTAWTIQSGACSKVDMLSFHAECFALAGLHKDQKRGVVEFWTLARDEEGPDIMSSA
ncbi:hypothetical protein EW145_g7264 [Phellinidium pouzarii]|uniref:Anaphase-promoting complex subunit 4 WD40 domain-containing protein n=1 Tax=Phellinidium pouzarii TaxID=167371 RepID=A0A4S4KMT6_9AGAM|nr:hypothetical protein EW145_g7264 [Phellinidium pouzarii]